MGHRGLQPRLEQHRPRGADRRGARPVHARVFHGARVCDEHGRRVRGGRHAGRQPPPRVGRRRGEHEPRADRVDAGALGLDPPPLPGEKRRRAHRPPARNPLRRREAARAGREEPRHGKEHGRALRGDGQGVEDSAGSAGPPRVCLPRACGQGDGQRLLRRSRDRRGRGVARRHPARRFDGGEAREAETRLRSRRRDDHRRERFAPHRWRGGPVGATDAGAQRLPPDRPRVRLVDWEIAAVDVFHEGLLMAPAYAIPRLLARNNLALDGIDLWEIHEAFAAQVLCNVAAIEDEAFVREKAGVSATLGKFPWDRLNPNGGSVAIGHPFGATGARILSQAVKELAAMGPGKRAVVSICADGGLGAVALLESA
ncbi:MAG: hypothetical protein IPH30_00490 [Betaproteobacteria bacterium]|nr:hypothetical protein [Betaproteobacteria bacterium]